MVARNVQFTLSTLRFVKDQTLFARCLLTKQIAQDLWSQTVALETGQKDHHLPSKLTYVQRP
jgi:hypothetical protein